MSIQELPGYPCCDKASVNSMLPAPGRNPFYIRAALEQWDAEMNQAAA